MRLSKNLQRCLDDLEKRIMPEEEDMLLQAWLDFSYGRHPLPVFEPRRRQLNVPETDWPQVSINSALSDYEQMAFQQYGACSKTLENGSGSLLNVRCNYGTSIMPSLFGAKLFIMDDALETLPTSWPLGSVEAVQHLLDSPIPDCRTGMGAKVLEMAEIFAEIALVYPKIGKYIFIYHPDMQGPMDICELLWGSSIFYALVDQPDLVHALLQRVTQTYIHFMSKWMETVSFHSPGNAHWGFYHLGNLMLRDDSAMNLSPSMVSEYVLPYDQQLLDQFGGGAIHFCGKGDHFIAGMSTLNGLHAVNLSQPHLNSMEVVFQHTIDKNINLLGISRQFAASVIDSGRDLYGRVHVVT